MAERYSRHFAIEEELYCPGSPVVIAAGALLRDNYTGHMLAQLKFKNISPSPVRALKLHLCMLDDAGQALGLPIEHVYRDLRVNRDEEFGRGTAIVLPEGAVCSFSVQVTEVLFEDGDKWSGGDGQWFPLPPRQTLADFLGDEELAVQYQTRYGSDCVSAPLEAGDLWFCVCGAVNSAAEPKCHKCRRMLSALKVVNLASLRSECDERIKNEQIREEAEKAESRVRVRRNKKWLKAVAVLVPLLVLAAGLYVTVPRVTSVQRSYAAAITLLEDGYYDEAEGAFAALGDYKDSSQQVQWNIPYLRANQLLALAEIGDASSLSLIGKTSADLSQEEYGPYAASALFYQAAGEAFAALGDYKDCLEQAAYCGQAVENCRRQKLQDDYDAAAALLEEGHYVEASAAFRALDGFGDSAEMAQDALYLKATALYKFTEEYSARHIYASITADPSMNSVFLLSRGEALNLGQDCIPALRAACGPDDDIRLVDDIEAEADGFDPMLGELAQFFTSLGSYKDSREYAEKLEQASDYTADFYAFIEEGDLNGAYEWLTAWEDDFDGREDWLAALELYMPLCGTWKFNTGDGTLILRSVGDDGYVNNVTSGVIFSDEDEAILRLNCTLEDGTERTIDLSAERGKTTFFLGGEDGRNYYAMLGPSGRLAYLMYDSPGSLTGSVDYARSQQEPQE